MKILTLGEIMLRLTTPKGARLRTSTAFQGYYGGGEANVAASLANFGIDTAYATILPNNVVGLGVKDAMDRFGVDTSQVILDETPNARLGTYYLEQGAGPRGSSVVYDRAHSAFAVATKLPWDIDALFGTGDAQIGMLHLSGIAPALNDFWRENILLLAKTAVERGIEISFDVNYRPKLWSTDECAAYLKLILPYVTHLSAGNRDAQVFLGLETIEDALAVYPNIKTIYHTTRETLTSEHNRLTGSLYQDGTWTHSKTFDIPNIVDRIGGGDAYASGILYGIVNHHAAQDIVDFATAASVLKHTVLGDMNQFLAAEVENFIVAGSDVSR
ncbi:MAG: sugar kinase [Lactobacillaceae bacterium]|nr:sugar kinase [Lactobacillaceae bacterium]